MAEIMIVGEAWGQREEEKGKPFVGPTGGLLNAFLSSAGIARQECYLTNVFNFRPMNNDLKTLCGPKNEGIHGLPALVKGKFLRKEYEPELKRLRQEISDVRPNVIAALGGTACWALLGDSRIKKLRGAPMVDGGGVKVLPTYHPAAVLRQYTLRPIVFADFRKIRKESHFPDVRRPSREFWLAPTLADMLSFEPYIKRCSELSVDIETAARMITCIGFAPDQDRAIVIPFIAKGYPDNTYWPTIEEEVEAWKIIRRWLTSGYNIIGQNFLYDARYLWERYHIPCHTVHADTMLMQHANQPEMEKGLGFLGSIYTDEPSWKFMRKDIKTLKKED